MQNKPTDGVNVIHSGMTVAVNVGPEQVDGRMTL